jgi:hypothetical protein
VITIEEAKGIQTKREAVVEGMQFDRGYVSPYFITNVEKMIADLADPYTLIHQKQLSGPRPMLPMLENIVQSGKPLQIVPASWPALLTSEPWVRTEPRKSPGLSKFDDMAVPVRPLACGITQAR